MAKVDPNAPEHKNNGPRRAKALIPAGPYLTTIRYAEKTLSNKGKERVTVTFEVKNGEHKGSIFREDFYLSEGAMWKLMNLAKAIGAGAFDPDVPSELMDTFVGNGKEVKITLAVDNTNPNGTEGRKIVGIESTNPEIKRVMDAERAERFGGGGKKSKEEEAIPF